jgi:hypothetical protein
MWKIVKIILGALVLFSMASTKLQAQDASVVCADTVSALLGGLRTSPGTAPGARAGDTSSINWSSATGHRGVCRLDREGRVFAVEVTQFPMAAVNPYALECRSLNYRRQDCALKGPGTAVLDRQLSNSRCTEGQNWGVYNATLWVDKGCGGRFKITPRPAWESYTTTCESLKDRRSECRLKGPAEVQLVRKLSKSSCRQGSSWDYQGDLLWVDKGCRASFQVSPASVQAPGFGNQREEALQACAALIKGLGFTVLEQQVTQLGSRSVDVKVSAERNRIKVDLMCRYDIASREARLSGG